MNSNRGGGFRGDRDSGRGGFGNGSFGSADNDATQFIPRGNDSDYNPDADFAGGRGGSGSGSNASGWGGMRSGDETRFETRYDASANAGAGAGIGAGAGAGANGANHQNGATPSGQYWAPLSDEERGYNRSSGPGNSQGYQQGSFSVGGSGADPRGDWSGQDDKESRGMSGTVKAIAIAAVVAIVALVVIVIIYLTTSGGGSGSNEETSTPTTSSSTTSPTSSTTETTSETTSPSLSDAQKRLEEEMRRLQENPPAIPGFGDVTSGYGSIPANLVGQSPLTAEAELRINGFQDITIYDADGNVTNSAVAVMGRVASVDPDPGSEVETSTPVNIYLE